jgi:hypothetical protein
MRVVTWLVRRTARFAVEARRAREASRVDWRREAEARTGVPVVWVWLAAGFVVVVVAGRGKRVAMSSMTMREVEAGGKEAGERWVSERRWARVGVVWWCRLSVAELGRVAGRRVDARGFAQSGLVRFYRGGM